MPNRHARRRAASLARKRKIEAKTPHDQPFGWSVPVEIQAASTDGNSRRKFTLNAYTGEPMRLYGYELPVVIDCASIDLSAQKIPALYDHADYGNNIVGQIEAVRVEGAGGSPPIVADGYFTPTDDPEDRANWVMKKADAGFQWQASVGGYPGRLERVEVGQTIALNGRTYAGPCYVSRNTTLREISFVILGADRRTSANLRARIAEEVDMKTFNAWLLASGIMNFDSLPAAVQAKLKSAYNATLTGSEGDEETESEPIQGKTPKVPAVDPILAENERIAANRQRIADIDRICAKYNVTEIEIDQDGKASKVNLSAHAIANNWDTQKVELEALRASRGNGPMVLTPQTDCTAQALEGALLLRAGGKLDNKAYQSNQAVAMKLPSWMRAGINDSNRNQIMDSAHRYSSYSAVDICREALRIAGKQVPHNRDEMIQAAFSGGSLTNIFTSSVNAVLLSSYMAAPDTTLGWTEEEEVNDFKTNEKPRMTLMGGGLTKHPRGGEAQHSERSDTAESYKIARYTTQWSIDEQDVIDDNLDALKTFPQDAGEAAAWLRPDLVYSIILSNPTLAATTRALFNTTDGNALTGAALAAATLRAAVKTMMLIQENNRNLNAKPTHILVPPSLKHLADELVNSSQILIAGTAGSVTERGNINSLKADGLIPVCDARLENGCIDPDSGTTNSGSTSTWYLASTYLHTIIVGYLRGMGRAPRVRTGQLEKGKYGQWWDVSMDIGAKSLDWRGLQRNVA